MGIGVLGPGNIEHFAAVAQTALNSTWYLVGGRINRLVFSLSFRGRKKKKRNCP